jgi:hypothetical protein
MTMNTEPAPMSYFEKHLDAYGREVYRLTPHRFFNRNLIGRCMKTGSFVYDGQGVVETIQEQLIGDRVITVVRAQDLLAEAQQRFNLFILPVCNEDKRYPLFIET